MLQPDVPMLVTNIKMKPKLNPKAYIVLHSIFMYNLTVYHCIRYYKNNSAMVLTLSKYKNGGKALEKHCVCYIILIYNVQLADYFSFVIIVTALSHPGGEYHRVQFSR